MNFYKNWQAGKSFTLKFLISLLGKMPWAKGQKDILKSTAVKLSTWLKQGRKQFKSTKAQPQAEKID